jgi:putative transposase
MEVMQEGTKRYRNPKIINSDQGTQYTSLVGNECLKEQSIQISMDGKARATHNKTKT